jgi:aryl-alcohol dehydrogenase-like predicted oxidoreductase
VEGELIPMARELGLGVTPWSPLRGGVLSGKYTRANAGQVQADRGARVTAFLNEGTYAIVDELARIAGELGVTPAAVALAWVQSRPGVASTIIGARRLDQLDQNLAALDVILQPEHKTALDRISEPTLNFPSPFLRMASSIMHAGATVNGESSELLPLWKEAAEKRY